MVCDVFAQVPVFKADVCAVVGIVSWIMDVDFVGLFCGIGLGFQQVTGD